METHPRPNYSRKAILKATSAILKLRSRSTSRFYESLHKITAEKFARHDTTNFHFLIFRAYLKNIRTCCFWLQWFMELFDYSFTQKAFRFAV